MLIRLQTDSRHNEVPENGQQLCIYVLMSQDYLFGGIQLEDLQMEVSNGSHTPFWGTYPLDSSLSQLKYTPVSMPHFSRSQLQMSTHPLEVTGSDTGPSTDISTPLKERQHDRILPIPRIQNNLLTFEGLPTEHIPYWQGQFHTSTACRTPLINSINIPYSYPSLGIMDTSLEERPSQDEPQPGDIVGDSAREFIDDIAALNFDMADTFVTPDTFLVKTEVLFPDALGLYH